VSRMPRSIAPIEMSVSEWIHVVVFSVFTAVAWVGKRRGRRLAKATIIGVVGLGLTISSAYLLSRWLPLSVVSVARDWLPSVLMLLVYRQTGEFFVRVDQRLQGRLERIDERALAPLLRWLSRRCARKLVAVCLEIAYLFCYPMIPMSLATLYVLGLRQHADHFWVIVLLSTYISYGLLSFAQTLPPRMLTEPWLKQLPANPVRALNLWILRHASIHANTFPSAHVAASTGAALVLATLAPRPHGALFVAVAAAIAVSTFTGRYHYALDAVAGTLVATIVFLAARVAGSL
jgi:membrane-associated phospholipid phosphatase